MSYTPTEWKTGDVITADKLNNMESGIVNAGSGGGGGGVVTYTFTIKESTGGSFPPGVTAFDVVETDAVPSAVATNMLAGNLCVIKRRLQEEDEDTGEVTYGNWEFGVFNKMKDYNTSPTSLFLATDYNSGSLCKMIFQGDANSTDRPWVITCQPITQ